jgi:hypothetical protein
MLTLLVGSSAAADPPAGCTTTAGQTTCVFAYTGATQDWLVPAGVTSAVFDLYGAAGGSYVYTGGWLGGAGGQGAHVHATETVTPSSTLHLRVGGQGEDGLVAPNDPCGSASGCTETAAGGFNGGGSNTNTCNFCGFALGGAGGGASDVRTSADGLANRLLVAGGGGGGGIGGDTVGNGGDSATDAPTASTSFPDSFTCSGGGAGTLVGPGAAGTTISGFCFSGSPGDAAGGAGGDGGNWIGAGGGGLFGGGAGAAGQPQPGTGGGGGSNLVGAGTATDGVRAGNCLITITYTVGLQGHDGSTHNAVEGTAMNNATLGTFTDPNTSAAASDFTATVCWNDGGTPPPNNDCGPATVSGSNGSFTVTGSHTFAEEGSSTPSYIPSTSVTGADGSVTLNMPVNVTDAALSATGVKASMSAGKSQTKVVANFKDADPGGTTSDYSATINWGDLTSTTGGLIAPNGSGGWSVTGAHKYAKPGNGYSVTVTITDSGGAHTSTVSVIKVNK